jgi:hypothetical protein
LWRSGLGCSTDDCRIRWKFFFYELRTEGFIQKEFPCRQLLSANGIHLMTSNSHQVQWDAANNFMQIFYWNVFAEIFALLSGIGHVLQNRERQARKKVYV